MDKILFDGRWILPERTGVGNFALNLIRALGDTGRPIGVVLSKNAPSFALPENVTVFHTGVDIRNHPLTELFEQVWIPWLCYRFGYTRFVSLEGRAPIFHPGIRTFPFIYDISFLQVKGSYGFKYRLFLFANLVISRLFATRILTISKSVRREIGSAVRIHPGKIAIITPSHSNLELEIRPDGVDGKTPFFLGIGFTNPRKNLEPLIRAFNRVYIENPNVALMLTGDKGFIEGYAGELPGIRNLGFVKDSELAWLYRNATALVFPSLNEGFGIPLLDAMRFKCPIICSDIAVFREVAGDYADYFNPASPADISDKMESILKSHTVNHRSSSNALRFSWEVSAEKLLAFVETLNVEE